MSGIDKATLRELAVLAGCDPRTIQKALRGEPVRGMAGHRARAVLEAIGVEVTRIPSTLAPGASTWNEDECQGENR